MYVTLVLQVLLPQHIPSCVQSIEWCRTDPARELLSRRCSADFSNVAFANELERAPTIFHRLSASRSALQKQSDDSAHDSFFQIARLEYEEAAVFAQMAVQARLILFRDVEQQPFTVEPRTLQVMDQALVDLLACMDGGLAGTMPAVAIWESQSEHNDPMGRWIRGHQVFAALTQGLIFSFQSMGRALRSGHAGEAARWADLSVSLLRGSAASFGYTGDFTPQEYCDVIRPRMSPPYAPICLSGLMSSDHRFFVQLTGKMKPALKLLGELEPARHQQLSEAMSWVYDSHIHVCERFVGDRPSLLTAGRTEKSGPALIEHFKSMRLKAFEGKPRVMQTAPSKTSPEAN